MIMVLLAFYVAILALFVWLGFIPLNRFWKFSPVIVLIALMLGVLIPMTWGRHKWRSWWRGLRWRSFRTSPAK